MSMTTKMIETLEKVTQLENLLLASKEDTDQKTLEYKLLINEELTELYEQISRECIQLCHSRQIRYTFQLEKANQQKLYNNK